MSTQTPLPKSAPRGPLGGASGSTHVFSRIGIIFRKEFREIFRDRRTTFSVVISPLFITPALLGLMGTLITGQTEKAQKQVYPVAIMQTSGASDLAASFRQASGLSFSTVSSTAEAEKSIQDGKLRAVAVVPEDATTLMQEQHSVPIKILMDAGSEASRTASGRLSALFDTAGKSLMGQRLQEKSLPSDFATPFQVTEEPIPQGGSTGTLVISALLPYMLALAAFAGGIYAAFDQVAGEKERGTLETLLVSPASRRDIVLGKFLAVAGVCLVSSFLSVVGLMIPFFSHLKAFDWLAKGGLHLGPVAFLVILLVQSPLAVMFAGLLLAISTFSRNQKEAQTYLAPLMFVVILPAMMSMFVQSESATKTLALVPVLNVTLILKQGLSGHFDPVFIALAVAASVAYAGLALAFATRLFQKESVLIKA